MNKIFLNGHAIADEDTLQSPTSILHSVLAFYNIHSGNVMSMDVKDYSFT